MKVLECTEDGRIHKFEAERAIISFTQTASDEIVLTVSQEDLVTTMKIVLVTDEKSDPPHTEMFTRLVKQERIKKKTTRGKDDGPKDHF